MDKLETILADIALWRQDEYHDVGSEAERVWEILDWLTNNAEAIKMMLEREDKAELDAWNRRRRSLQDRFDMAADEADE